MYELKNTDCYRCFITSGKGKPFQRRSKPQKKKEEKERRGKGKSQEDELKDSLADDDSSSTTTETSNPDTEVLLKEVEHLKRRWKMRGWAGGSERQARSGLFSRTIVTRF